MSRSVLREPEEPIEQAARASYGRLLAYVSSRTRDVASAEDALAEAFVAALESWPREGVPQRPEAWLLSVARRRLIDQHRRASVLVDALQGLVPVMRQASERADEGDSFPDERLRLLFVCAHPAIDESVHAPLMLQTVLGLDAARIASAFLVAPSAMSQRLVRGKAKIRDAGIRFETPSPDELPARLDPVLQAIYAAYGSGWDDLSGPGLSEPGGGGQGLAREALSLGRTLWGLLPDEPEAAGLVSLMLYCESRRAARRDEAGLFVPLDEQPPSRWDTGLIEEAERGLLAASRLARPGRFQLEAAIQSAHMHRIWRGDPGWDAIVGLYDALVDQSPSLGAQVGRAAAIARARGPLEGLSSLNQIDGRTSAYQPAWALRADLLGRLGREQERTEALTHAIGLTSDPAVRAFLQRRASEPPARG